jgi:hypothetical protein
MRIANLILIVVFKLSNILFSQLYAQVDCWECPFNDCSSVFCKVSNTGTPYYSSNPDLHHDSTGSGCEWICGEFGRSESCQCWRPSSPCTDPLSGCNWSGCNFIHVTICYMGPEDCYPSGNCGSGYPDPSNTYINIGPCAGC